MKFCSVRFWGEEKIRVSRKKSFVFKTSVPNFGSKVSWKSSIVSQKRPWTPRNLTQASLPQIFKNWQWRIKFPETLHLLLTSTVHWEGSCGEEIEINNTLTRAMHRAWQFKARFTVTEHKHYHHCIICAVQLIVKSYNNCSWKWFERGSLYTNSEFFSFSQCTSMQNSTNPAIWLVTRAGRIITFSHRHSQYIQ